MLLAFPIWEDVDRTRGINNVLGVPIPNMPATAVITDHCAGYCGHTGIDHQTRGLQTEPRVKKKIGAAFKISDSHP